jgi:hypothetical protein
MKLHTKWALLGAVAAMSLGAASAQAQVGLTSSVANVQINATKNSVLTVAVNSGGTQTLASLTDNAVNAFPTPVSVTTTWDLNAGTNVVLVGSFATPAQALASGTNYITSTYVKGSMNGGAFAAFTQAGVTAGANTVGSAGGSLTLFTQGSATTAGTRTDNLGLEIDLTGHPNLVPGTYSGTLNLQAIVQ